MASTCGMYRTRSLERSSVRTKTLFGRPFGAGRVGWAGATTGVTDALVDRFAAGPVPPQPVTPAAMSATAAISAATAARRPGAPGRRKCARGWARRADATPPHLATLHQTSFNRPVLTS